MKLLSGPKTLAITTTLLLLSGNLAAQALEPRRWTHLPVNLNFFAVATGYSSGEVLLDPVLRIEDTQMNLATVGASYVRTFGWFGQSARIELTLPWHKGEWRGLVNDIPSQIQRQGFSDPRLRLAVNFYGAPALKGQAYVDYRRKNPIYTTAGASLSISAPFGDYRSDQLINLGGNRWILAPGLGVQHNRGDWQFEATTSIIFYGHNNEFWRGTQRKQDPMGFIQGHISRTFKPGLWAGISAGYGYGGPSYVNGVSKFDDARSRYWAVSLGIPINRQQGLKVAYVWHHTNVLTGSKLDSVALSWRIIFGQ